VFFVCLFGFLFVCLFVFWFCYFFFLLSFCCCFLCLFSGGGVLFFVLVVVFVFRYFLLFVLQLSWFKTYLHVDKTEKNKRNSLIMNFASNRPTIL
jgi:hypothetical protein